MPDEYQTTGEDILDTIENWIVTTRAAFTATSKPKSSAAQHYWDGVEDGLDMVRGVCQHIREEL